MCDLILLLVVSLIYEPFSCRFFLYLLCVNTGLYNCNSIIYQISICGNIGPLLEEK